MIMDKKNLDKCNVMFKNGQEFERSRIRKIIQKHIDECEPHCCCGDEILEEVCGHGKDESLNTHEVEAQRSSGTSSHPRKSETPREKQQRKQIERIIKQEEGEE